mgnify:CR=1 FL=1
MKQYYIADVLNTGSWDIVEEFEAANDEAANIYAAANHGNIEWYVLDQDQENINNYPRSEYPQARRRRGRAKGAPEPKLEGR